MYGHFPATPHPATSTPVIPPPTCQRRRSTTASSKKKQTVVFSTVYDQHSGNATSSHIDVGASTSPFCNSVLIAVGFVTLFSRKEQSAVGGSVTVRHTESQGQ